MTCNDGFDKYREDYEKTRQPNDHGLVVISGPYPKCPKCGHEMICMRLFHNETHLREYLKCIIPSCRYKLQFDDCGNAILEDN